ncbi:putative lipid II flippase FtsW [Sporichthya brevicatena]|uniref:Probable peptidoglycan glycosyltransferase FtsW n=1 Tax=Sporichthya brevicatena TaxID=171442 RepID=A0ABN1GSV7_9ACTN
MAVTVDSTGSSRGLSGVGVAARLRALDRPLTSYYLVLTSTLLLVALGLVMVLSASSVESYRTSGSVFSVVQKQAIWVSIGLPLMWVTSRMSVATFRRLAFPGMAISLLGLAAVLLPGVGHEVNGNRNWIHFGGPFQLQPSEAAKLALVLFGATVLARKQRLLDRWSHLMIPLVPMAAGVIFLVMLGGDLGTTVVLLAILLALLFFAGTPMRFFGFFGAFAGALVLLLIWTEPYRMRRVTSFLDPFASYHDSGWQGAQSIFALASGGLTGVGLGASREKWGYLPEAHTDFIYAIIGEELGLIGALAVLALFAALVVAGFRIAARSRDMFVTLAASAITAWIAVQALVNMGAVLGVLPITGIPLPLVSYGGSALLPVMAALGMLLSFARQEPGAQAALAARGPGPLRRAMAWLGFGRSPRT